MKTLKLLISVLFLILFSCAKDDTNSEPKNPEVDVFVADNKGNVFKNGSKINFNVKAAIQIDGIGVRGMVFENSKIFQYGSYTSNGSTDRACYFQEGNIKPINYLADKEGRVTSLQVIGNDVYTVGFYNTPNIRSIFCKNGELLKEITGEYANVTIIDFQIVGTKVFFIGYDSGGGNSKSKLWVYDLNNLNTGELSSTNYSLASNGSVSLYDLEVVGNDVYVLVSEVRGSGSKAIYWKNEIKTEFQSNDLYSFAYKIKIVNNDVYAAGETLNSGSNVVAKYWKNAIPITLSNNETVGYESRGIAINGTDVYNVGSQNSNPTTPKLWINNTETPVQDAASGSRFVAIALQSK
jgi:hypothetical protein